jgi:hypothetical protein
VSRSGVRSAACEERDKSRNEIGNECAKASGEESDEDTKLKKSKRGFVWLV